MSSTAFFAAPRNGVALSPVSSAPRKNPFRFMVAATVATAIAAPMIGTLRDSRRETLAPPQRATCCVTVIPLK
jgi:hypothetical protein